MAVSGIGRRLPIVVILGATGAGKSKLALQLAERFNGEIISTDAMQVYQELDIVTNKVTIAEKAICPHHMIDVISPHTTNYTVINFRNTALPLIDDIMSRKRIPFLVGGTNYYIEALLWKLLIDTQSKESPPGEREEIAGDDWKKLKCDPITTNKTQPVKEGQFCSQDPKIKLSRDLLLMKDTQELYLMLMDVDKERALRLHPKDRRKIIRSLEVFHQEGRTMSDLLREQHQGTGEGALSGPLRYAEPCVIWVQCEQHVLDARTDARVDQMIGQGLIQELTDFHSKYNASRIAVNKDVTYTEGIFQSIGLKEFHDYLILPESQRQSEHGRKLLQTGIEDMKTATRQYSRYQKKWIMKRFLQRRGGGVPRVYGVDSTDKSKWDTTVMTPAAQVLSSYLQGSEAPFPALPQEEGDFEPQYNRCDVCDVVTLTAKTWQIHIQGRRHKKSVQRHRRLQALEAKLLAGAGNVHDVNNLSDTQNPNNSDTENLSDTENDNLSDTEHTNLYEIQNANLFDTEDDSELRNNEIVARTSNIDSEDICDEERNCGVIDGSDDINKEGGS